jgi:hypothetical protein
MRSILTGLFILILGHAFAREDQDSVKEGSRKSLLSFFRDGKANGHFRYYLMATDNSGSLTDYYANALGGGLRFETAKFHGFQLGIAGFYIFNIGSSNLVEPDPSTKQLSRYESGQFDILDPGNKHDLDRLEDLYLKYSISKTTVVAGRQAIKSPFINLQDGRMRPTAESGIWIQSSELEKTEILAGVFHAISPRGTLRWFNMGTSIGVYSQGVSEDGKRSDYAGNINSEVVALLGVNHQLSGNIKIQAWNQLVENVFNSALFQTDAAIPVGSNTSILTGFQYIRQDAVNDGGNQDQTKTYVSRNWKSNIFGGKIGLKINQAETSLSYTRITKDGRFIMPREWGREPLFTFMPRERNEGAGDVHAWVYRVSKNFTKHRLKPELSAGYYRMPDVRNFRLNKYGMPSYWQVNFAVKHEFEGFLEGLDAEIIALYKGKMGETYENPSYEFNKVDMFHLNVILNYHF